MRSLRRWTAAAVISALGLLTAATPAKVISQ